MLTRMNAFAQNHPSLFSGVWFALSALLLVSPLALMVLLLLGLEVLAGRPVSAYLGMMFAAVGLPLIPSFGMGALVGPRILRLPPGKRGYAAGWGAMAALGALLLWILILEVLPRLFGGSMQTAGSGGDVPGAAEVVGYLVVLPLIVILPLLAGAGTGLLLQAFATRAVRQVGAQKRAQR